MGNRGFREWNAWTYEYPTHCSRRRISSRSGLYGATKVTLILADGRRIENVFLGGAEWIVKVGDRLVTEATELDFAVGGFVDVIPERNFPALWWACLEALRAAVKR